MSTNCDVVDPNVEQAQPKMGMLSRLLRLSPLGSKSEAQSSKNEPVQTFYGVYIPYDSENGHDEFLHVYQEKTEALQIVKKFKKARFKAFKNHQEAVAFALQGTEPIQERESSNNGNGLLPVDSESNTNPAVGEKSAQFKGPKPQEMVQFRKHIETGNMELVRKTAWENPRYLVSSGDTPSILQEGSRYNALHVAVKAQNVEMCDFVLSTISDPNFVQLLYGDDNIESSKERAVILLDLYLNTPDKAINETPLHFAVKFGVKDIVDLLVSYPQCSKTQTNKFGEQPKDIICQRSKGSEGLVKEISTMLQDRFYVPVLHSEDDSKQPIIGDLFSPSSPPALNNDPISPRLEIRAFAGPMNKSEAQTFRKKWKTPPRTLNTGKTPLAAARFRLQDIEKGLEKVGRDLAQQFKIGWKEYWPFLDTFTDLTSIEGLGLLNDYLKNKFAAQWSSSSDSISENLHMSPQTPVESFCKSFIEKNQKNTDQGLSPISELCVAFKSLNLQKNLNDSRSKLAQGVNIKKKDSTYNKFDIEGGEIIMNSIINPGLNPYMCIEKSCQVFAKRLNSYFTEPDFNCEHIRTEIKRLQQTIASYMDDVRFHTVDFHLIHSRVAQLASQKLLLDNRYNEDLDYLKTLLKKILDSKVRYNSTSESSSEDEDLNPYRPRPKKDQKKAADISAQIKCLAKNMLHWLSEKDSNEVNIMNTEEECMNIWSKMSKCNCPWQTENLKNHRKMVSVKRNQLKSREGCDILSSSPKYGMDIVAKRLQFEQDNMCENNERNANYSSSPENNRIYKKDNIACKLSSNFKTLNTNEEDDFKNIDNDLVYDSDGEVFGTPRSNLSTDEDFSDYEDIDNTESNEMQAVDIFINGTKPTKTDKSVFDALCDCEIDVTKYPFAYRWRHMIALHSKEERNSWPSDEQSNELDSPITCSFNIGHISNFGTPTHKYIKNVYSVSIDEKLNSPKCIGSAINPIQLMTPIKTNLKDQSITGNTPPMQMSKWMRITGPNSPRSVLLNRSYTASFDIGF